MCNKAREKDVLGSVTITKDVTIPSGTRTVIHGHTRAKAISSRISVMLEEDPLNSLLGGLLMTPTVMLMQPGGSSSIGVEVSNVSAKAVTIPRKSVICQVRTAEIVSQRPQPRSVSE